MFAAGGFLLGGIDDLCVDLAWLWQRLRHGSTRRLIAQLPHPPSPGRIAIFVPTWDEPGVIGAMLSTALARLDHPNYRLYVACYPNDPATIAAVRPIVARDPRVRLVIGTRPGPTTKADNLNSLWHALRRDDAQDRAPTRIIVLHDAEDVMHPDELTVYDALIATTPLVQIPVVPLIDPAARLVSGHYADEFAESHGRQMVLRAGIGAGLPLSGVGCAIAVDVLTALEAVHGQPFDEASLTEDYELGLRAAALGYPACFARVTGADGRLISVRAFFPSTIDAAIRQKARWMTGIALAGWDRIGWGRRWHVAEHWMRMRDRRVPLAVIVLFAAYLAILGWAASFAAHFLIGTARPEIAGGLRIVLLINAGLLAWRLAWRIGTTTYCYGWREGLWSLPRALVGNLIGLFAARYAMGRYARILAGSAPRWDKTAHVFPTLSEEPAAR